MTRFHRADLAAYADLVQVLTEELRGYGLRLTRADYRQFQDELWSNVCQFMDSAQFGIAIFDRFDDLPVSLNVSLELGYMLAKGKRCLLLRDKLLSGLQADLAGHLCYEIDQRDIARTVSNRVRVWLQDLGVAKRPDEKLLIFVSSGGTCRDPMAKIVLEKMIERSSPPFRLRIEARGLYPHGAIASMAARRAIAEVYGSDLLADHRPRPLAERYIQEADLILVMNTYLMKALPAEKTFVLNQYFGLPGEVADPWPDGVDEGATNRYSSCLAELRRILEGNYGTLIDRLASGSVSPWRHPQGGRAGL
jgi:protein-tyrosine-phosphatase